MTDRFIIVLGMAHSGTTIFTKILSQCPQIKLFTNGKNSPLLENDYLWNRDKNIIKLLNDFKEKYILLKRPWVEEFVDFLVPTLPNAHYYIMLKTFEQQSKSWSKPNSLVETELRVVPEVQRARYERCLGYALNFPLPHKIIHYSDLLNNPEIVFNKISQDLQLDYNFDVSRIIKYRKIKYE